jgi:hypothetical protein
VSVLLRCRSGEHTVRLDPIRFWRKAFCPRCKTPLDPTRLRRIITRVASLFSELFHGRSENLSILSGRVLHNGAMPIPDEFKFATLKRQIDELAMTAWGAQENLGGKFILEPSDLPVGSPDKAIAAILNHARAVAPGLSVPLRIPRVETGAMAGAGGQFATPRGWAAVNLSGGLLTHRKAVRAVLEHEACRYILNNSGIRRQDYRENEVLTDLCMFVCGLGELFLSGYKSEATLDENRGGHRLGYLKDAEYEFAARYFKKLRKGDGLKLPTRGEALRRKLVSRVSDFGARERLIRRARERHRG